MLTLAVWIACLGSRVALKEFQLRMVRTARFFALALYAVYAWSLFFALGATALFLMLVTPSLKARRAIGCACARLWLRLAGIVVDYRDGQLLPQEPAVAVANHSSYLDGILLKAVLPVRYAFVIKKEMVRIPLAGLLLRRLGAEFVDRFNRHSGAMDARRIMRNAIGGGSLVFFPEGTFSNRVGLARFHGGAFAIAARSNLPVAPIAIRGARRVLRSDSLALRPGRIVVQVLPSVHGGPQHEAHVLRDQSRARILLALGEPDLADLDGVAEMAARMRERDIA